MSLSALLVTAFVESMTPGPRMASCTFPAANPEEPPISLAFEARPSLMDVEGRFRVRLHLGEDGEAGGLAQAIDRTDARDVLIRARLADGVVYTIGLRDDGLAALNLLSLRAEPEDRAVTREGACRDFSAMLETWLRF